MSKAQQYFNQEHQQVRDSVSRFVEREILPFVDAWEEAEEFPRELYLKAGAAGILGIGYPEKFGGSYEGDLFAKVAASEELMRSGSGGLVAGLGSLDIGLPPVLKDVSFVARRGERIALVGPTGAGKSTITQLLLRLYDGGTGVVRVDGDDVAGLSRAELRRRFAVVPQDVYLFPGTVATNVAAGEPPDRDRVRQALDRMGALDLFERRPKGIDTPVDEHGANFSAGERQLIALSRALYRDAPILILDEATANIDSDTESRIQRALDELLKDRTAIVIAHRLSTIRRADRIVVFHKGRVVEQGTHQELLEHNGLYARLHELQFARGAGAAAE